MNLKKPITVVTMVLLVLGVFALTLPVAHAHPKSLYLVADHHTAAFQAWDIGVGGIATYQATYSLTHAGDPGGIAIDESSNTLFITSEFDYGVELVDATTMTSLGWVTGAYGLAGIDTDDANDIVYTVDRDTDDLYAYSWDPVAKSLTPITGFNPYNLPNCQGAFGIAFDAIAGILWVADSRAGVARAYVVDIAAGTVTEDTSMSFTPSLLLANPVDITVDRVRGFVYTVSMTSGAATPPGTGSNLISKYDLATGTETAFDIGHEGVGIAVDEVTGYVYVTGARDLTTGVYVDNLEVWDPSTSPWTQVQATGDLGNPAGICIPREEVAYNPLGLSKSDTPDPVLPGDTITYTITYDNTPNPYDVHNVVLVDTLPPETTFSSAAGPTAPSYDSATHTVTWNLGDLGAGTGPYSVTLTVTVKSDTLPGTTIVNYATIDSDETPPTTVTESTLVGIPEVIPEYPLGTIMGLLACFAALAVFIIPKRHRLSFPSTRI